MKTYEPVRLAVTVPREIEDAFELFTARLGTWWPLRTHSVGEERALDARMECRPGGRFYEVLADGTEHDWGIVDVFEAPHRVRVRWRVNHEMPDYTEWEVTFTPAGQGTTRVVLEHRGWERLLEHANDARSGYSQGWPAVLDAYAEVAGSLA